jgi:hypothetical protein
MKLRFTAILIDVHSEVSIEEVAQAACHGVKSFRNISETMKTATVQVEIYYDAQFLQLDYRQIHSGPPGNFHRTTHM